MKKKEFFLDVIKKIGETIFGDKKAPEYYKYIRKCDLSISLDSYSFIPYYLRGFCKILNEEEGLDDLKKSLNYIEKEIILCNKLINKSRQLNVNTTFLENQINILNNIKIHIIEKNIEDYKDLKTLKLKINKKKFDDIFSFNDNADDPNNKDRIIPKYSLKHFLNLKSDGLTYFFFIKEKASLIKIGSYILGGLTLIGLSICILGIAPGIVSAGLMGASSIIGLTSISQGIDYFRKGYEDDFFPDSYNLGLFNLFKKRKKVRRFIEFMNDICIKHDNDYQNKKNKADEQNI